MHVPIESVQWRRRRRTRRVCNKIRWKISPFAFLSFPFDLMMKGILFSVCGIQEGQLEAGRNPLHPLYTLELYMRVVKLDEFDAEIVTSRRKYFLGILKSGRNISSFSVWLKLAGSFCSFPFAFVGFPFSCNPCWCFSVVKRSCINRQEVAAAYGSAALTRRGETRTPQKGETRCSLIWCFTARKVHCSV